MSTHQNNLKVKALSTFSSKGKRPAQEDFLIVDGEKGFFIVADGFGGPSPGLEASKIACESIRSFLFKEAGDLDATLPFVLRSYFSLAGNVLFNSLIHANRKVRALNKNKNVHECGGASVIAGFIDGDLLAIANVGVCTAWLFRNGKAIEMVIPRSFGKLCDPFSLEMQENLKVPLMALGLTEDLEPEIFEYRLQRGDWVVFESDGIPNKLHSEIALIQSQRMSSSQAIQEVSKILKNADYQDNASISLIIF